MAIADIQFGIEISPVVPITSFNVGGSLEIGQFGSPNIIKASVYVGFGLKPKDNYFYAEVKPFTLGDIAKVFELKVDGFPQPVLDTGFPDGILTSYALDMSKS